MSNMQQVLTSLDMLVEQTEDAEIIVQCWQGVLDGTLSQGEVIIRLFSIRDEQLRHLAQKAFHKEEKS